MKETGVKYRSESIDALRGFAILMMILSGAVPFSGALPAWMYHAQEPPPLHSFCPNLPGITWVDLVFPFFIFSMGAALPFAFSSRGNDSPYRIFGYMLKRWIGLVVFAFVVYYIKPWVINDPSMMKYVFSIAGFVGLFFMFISLPNIGFKKYETAIHIAGFVFMGGLLFFMHSTGVITVSLQNFDIIMMILSGISLFGGLLWWASKGSLSRLLGCWFLLITFYAGAKLDHTWVTSVWNYSPVNWLIGWEYLKYLLILIPGIWAGKLIRQTVQSVPVIAEKKTVLSSLIAGLSLLLIFQTVYFLFVRDTISGFVLMILLVMLMLILLLLLQSSFKIIIQQLLYGGFLLLLAGFFVEPLQGGIKKDYATLSYMFITAGLAVFMLIALFILLDIKLIRKPFAFLTGSGKNAMLAYFIGGCLIYPLFALTGLNCFIENLSHPVLWETVRAGVLTLMVAFSSAWMAKRRFMIKA